MHIWSLNDIVVYLLLTMSMPFPIPRKKGLIRVLWTTTAVVATALLTFLTPGLITCSYACPVTPTTLSSRLTNLWKDIYLVQTDRLQLASLIHGWFQQKFLQDLPQYHLTYHGKYSTCHTHFNKESFECVLSKLLLFQIPWLDKIDPKNADDGTTRTNNNKISRIFQQLDTIFSLYWL